jgi:hypothetical protein
MRRKGHILGLGAFILFLPGQELMRHTYDGPELMAAYKVWAGLGMLYLSICMLWLVKTWEKRVAGSHLLKAYGKRRTQETISSAFDNTIGIPADHPLHQAASRVVRLSRHDANASAIVDDLISSISSAISELDSLRGMTQANRDSPLGESLSEILAGKEALMKRLTDALSKLHAGLSQQTRNDHQQIFSQTSDLLAALAAKKEVDQLTDEGAYFDAGRDSEEKQTALAIGGWEKVS